MRHTRARRRVGLTRQAAILLAVFAALTTVTALGPLARVDTAATVGLNDYPSRLRTAAQDSLVDPWLFYNRECTSFVAWRLNHDAGIDFHNYYLGVHWGNASNWKYAASQVGIPVDSRPERGAVAWWPAGSAGSSRGHVAWVSGVTQTSITIEEYNYLSAGRYDQRTISTSSSMWPSAFIHIGNRALRNTTAPTIGGTAKVGSRLVARPGSWSLSGASYSYQWLADGSALSFATHRSFAPRAAQVGKRIQVRVTASVDGLKPVSATSARSAAVAPGDLVLNERPSVTGTAQVGNTLTANPGSWTPSATYTYRWFASGEPIDGATARRLRLRADQLAQRIQVKVTASAPGRESRTVASDRTSLVVPGDFAVSDRPAVTGTAQVDSQLSATTGTWSPNATYSFQWRAAGVPVAGADAATFIPTAEQLGQRISVTVTARRAGYTTANATSTRTAGVAMARFAATGPPTISGSAQVDKPLTVSPGRWSPMGTPSYQWFVAGVAVPGATGTTFTPRAADLRRQVTVKVTMVRPGYATATSASAATEPVLPGTFQNTSDPTITGTPRVGLTLTAHPGGWTPTPSLSYQWFADGTAITGATAATFTPTAAELAKHLTVQVTARRTGYLTALVESAPTAGVTPGTITALERPAISGRPVVGSTLTATAGRWSVKPSSTAYQWYAGGVPISGATGSSYSPTAQVLDQRLRVRVTVSADGYLAAGKASAQTTPVVLGQVSFTSTPTLTGTTTFGHLLTAHPGSSSPDNATASYVWLRAGEPIRGATGSTYRLVAADVGHRIAVQITLSAPHWQSRSTRVGTGSVVRSVPQLTVRSRVSGHRVVLRFVVTAPGLPDPDGKVLVTERGAPVGKALVTDGRGRLSLRQVTSGVHHYRFSYAGPLQTTVTRRLDVTVP